MTARPPGTKHFAREGEIVSHELLTLAYPRLVELLASSRAAQTVADHVELQKDLAKEGWKIRDLHRQLTDRKKTLRAELAERRGEREATTAISQNLRGLDLAIEANRRHWYALRVIQDGIVWRLLGFHRHRIAILGDGTPVNWLSESFPSEVAGAEERWDAGRLAILCDLSNCIRTGDLLVFETENDRVVVTEVKESDRGSEETKQFRGMRVKVEYLNSGRSEDLAPDAPLVVPGNPPRLKTHLSVLADLLTSASSREGWAIARAGQAAAVYAFDLLAVDPEQGEETIERWKRADQSFGASLGSAWPAGPTYSGDSLSRLRRDQRNAVAGIAPVSIFPLSPEQCVALSIGWTCYRTVLNLGLLEAALKRRGLRVRSHGEGPGDKGVFLQIEGEGGRMHAPPILAEQLLVELLTASAFVSAVQAAFSRLAAETSPQLHVGVGWSGEGRVWH